ncbi:MAG: AAA family ATPase [Methanomicrobiales archaeon]|nr:AAA family ATPase [Methanomicrobiales archaeon]
MMICITGTPGTGKTTVAAALLRRGYPVTHAGDTIDRYVLEEDARRDTKVVDTDRWAGEFVPVEGFVEGHLSHLLAADAVVVLRCRPDVLAERLRARGYRQAKIRENADAEALDVILVETLEHHPGGHIFEVDTTACPAETIADMIEDFMKGKRAPQYGSVDWSAFLVPSP